MKNQNLTQKIIHTFMELFKSQKLLQLLNKIFILGGSAYKWIIITIMKIRRDKQ